MFSFFIGNAGELVILINYDTNKLIWYLVAEQVAHSVSVLINFLHPPKESKKCLEWATKIFTGNFQQWEETSMVIFSKWWKVKNTT